MGYLSDALWDLCDGSVVVPCVKNCQNDSSTRKRLNVTHRHLVTM